VVVRVGVDIEQCSTRVTRDDLDHVGAASLAHVDDALEHRPTLAQMDVGLALPQFDYSVPGEDPLQWETVIGWAARAEQLGFDSVWLADHLFLSVEKYGAPPGRHFGYDPLVALAAIARRTTRVRLGTLVLCSQLRPPTVLAKAIATLDVLSSGRVVLGMGAGWYEPEFDAAGIPFHRPAVRLAELAEAIQVVRGMCAGGPFSFEGDHVVANHAHCRPASVQQPSPPIWVGGRGDRLIEVAARHADGWNTVWRMTLDEWRARSAVADEACDRLGRDPTTLGRSIGLYTLVGEDERDLRRRFDRLQAVSPPGVVDGSSLDDFRHGHLVGTVEQVADQLDAWRAAGVASLVVGAGVVPFAVAAPDDVEMVAAACTIRKA
jgi:probable F420-dependent oxidoreductase